MKVVAAAFCFLAACASNQTQSNPQATPENRNAAALAPGAHHVVLNGVRFYYVVGGQAPTGTPPVVFLHGGPGQGSEHFAALAGPFMERELRMIYYDQRGSGWSERPVNRDYAITSMVDDIEALRLEFGTPKLALIGHSFGSVLALEYAAKYPNKVAHLIVVDGLWDTQVQCPLRLARFAELRPEAYERGRGDTIRSDGSIRNQCDVELRTRNGLSAEDKRAFDLQTVFGEDSAVARRLDSVTTAMHVVYGTEVSGAVLNAGMNRYRFTQLDRVTMPTLVIAGRLDGAVPPEGLRILAEHLPHARYLEFERSGHFPYLNEPDRFAREVTAFIRSTR
jgi:proline iminopeptidase